MKSKTVWIGYITAFVGVVSLVAPTVPEPVAKWLLMASGIAQVVQRTLTIKAGKK